MLSGCSYHITRLGIKRTNCNRWIGQWHILWPSCEINPCHRVSVLWDSSFILKQHCPRLWKCCGLSNAKVWNQSVSLNLGPLRFHQLSSTTSLAPDLPNFSPLSNSTGQVEMLHRKKSNYSSFSFICKVNGISFVSHNLITLLLCFLSFEFGN